MDNIIYFKALSDETRIRLANVLLHHDLKVGELVSVMEMGQSRISRHLKILSDAGMVKCLKEGVWGIYSIADKGPGRNFIEAVRYLFEGDAVLEQDLQKARQVMEARSPGTLRFFDHIASNWDLLKREIIGSFDLTGAIFEKTGRHELGVDLGCGTGELLDAMKSRANQVIGVDSSPRMLEEARKRFSNASGQNVEIRLGEVEHLPLGDNQADLAVISLVLQYLAAPQTAIAEVARILKPNGELILAEFNRHQQHLLKTVYGVKWLGFTRETIESWLNQNKLVLSGVDTHQLSKELELNIFRAAAQG